MKKLLFILSIFFSASLFAQQEVVLPPYSAALIYQMPDTLKAVQYYNEVIIDSNAYAKATLYGSYFSEGIIGLQADKKGRRSIIFKIGNKENREVKLIAKGLHVDGPDTLSVAWKYDWQVNHSYKFLLTVIVDSASQSTYYTGYVFLPVEQKWKLLASFQKMGDGKYIEQPGTTVSLLDKNKKEEPRKLVVQQAWLQRENGSWKELNQAICYSRSAVAKVGSTNGGNIFVEHIKFSTADSVIVEQNEGRGFAMHPRPTIDLTKHVDSLEQLNLDLQEIYAAVQSGKIDTIGSKENIFYKILKEGNGDYVSINDTVTVFYKGSLLKDGSVFDSTKAEPVTFPLKRLIKGWQVVVPLLKVGGKIRMVIPSSLAYSIRSRSKDISPNSVLVFDVEVVGAKR